MHREGLSANEAHELFECHAFPDEDSGRDLFLQGLIVAGIAFALKGVIEILFEWSNEPPMREAWVSWQGPRRWLFGRMDWRFRSPDVRVAPPPALRGIAKLKYNPWEAFYGILFGTILCAYDAFREEWGGKAEEGRHHQGAHQPGAHEAGGHHAEGGRAEGVQAEGRAPAPAGPRRERPRRVSRSLSTAVVSRVRRAEHSARAEAEAAAAGAAAAEEGASGEGAGAGEGAQPTPQEFVGETRPLPLPLGRLSQRLRWTLPRATSLLEEDAHHSHHHRPGGGHGGGAAHHGEEEEEAEEALEENLKAAQAQARAGGRGRHPRTVACFLWTCCALATG